ncbi:MAG: peptide ABC transporter substrate-binding protein [Chloroflexota bacterium]
MKRVSRILALMLVLVAVVGMFSVVSAQDEGVFIQDGQAFGENDVPTLDPSLASDTSSVAVIGNTSIPLANINELTLEVEPGFATEWTYDEESRTYTFSLLEGVPWVEYDEEVGEVVEVLDENGDVRIVTASDFAYGITRTLAPDTAADYQYVLSPYVDGLEVEDGAVASIEGAMVSAVDDFTLAVTVPEEVAGVGFIPAIFGLWFTSAQPEWLIQEFGETWIEDENIQSYGPFVVSEWLNDESLTMVTNPFWPGTDFIPQASVDGVKISVMSQSVSLAEFEAGNLDIASVPTIDIPRILADPALSESYFIAPGTCTYYYGYNVEKAPFDDVRVRQAFSLAMNRQSLSDNVLQGTWPPAGFFARPELAAAPSKELTPDLGVPFTDDYDADVAAAAELLQSYLDDEGITVDDLPPITLMHNESELHASIAQAAQQMWADALGVDVSITTQEWGVYLETLNNDAPQIWRLGWCLDFPDAHNFLFDVHHSSNSPRTNYIDAEFDALVEEARLLTDIEARRELYTQADNLISWEASSVAPLMYYSTQRMFSDRFDFEPSRNQKEAYYKWTLSE